MDDRKENVEENFFLAKIALEEALFTPLIKAKKQHQILKNTWNKKDAQ